MLAQVLSLLVPNPSGALWIGALIAILIFADTSRLAAPRNRALCAMLVIAPMLAYIFRVVQVPGVAPLLFTALFLAIAGIAAWGAWLALRSDKTRWTANLERPLLRTLVIALIVLNTAVMFGRNPDDAGYYTSLGAQRWTETGILPYGDPLLNGPASPGGGAGAAYGPLLFAAHIPAQYLIGPPHNPVSLDPMNRAYRRPDNLATQLTCFAFYLLGVGSLFTILRRNATEDLALGGVALFASSPYVLGLGATDYTITGLGYISHIAPSAMMLAAMAVLRRPIVGGALLAAAAGLMFYPAFVFPLWVGWMAANKAGALRFATGFIGVGILIAAIVLWYTPAPEGTSAVQLFMKSTLEVQEGTAPGQYGSSSLSFWGTHPTLAQLLHTPIAGASSLWKPTFIAYAALALASFFLAWRARSLVGLAGLTVMLTAAVQLWKTHATGSYVEWYYPFLIIALLIPAKMAMAGRPPVNPPERPELL